MGFIDSVQELAKKVSEGKHRATTEEATKTAFILPFINDVLGYNVFSLTEVVPEFTADVGTKQGEKVDYAIMKNGKPLILIECKKIGEPLKINNASQLFRYFATTDARIAVLTNGQEYQVYTDIDDKNRMDEKPFLVFDLLNIDKSLMPELEKLSKDEFDLESVISSAEELKYIGMIKGIISREAREPSNDWLKFFIAKSGAGNATQKTLDLFRGLVIKAVEQYVKGRIDDRLQTALDDRSAGSVPGTSEKAVEAAGDIDRGVVTTDEELDGFKIVRAIAVAEVPAERVVYRDAKTYFAVLLDDNNRKPIIRLHLNNPNVKFVTTFETDNTGNRYDIETVVDIYKVADLVRQAIRRHEAVQQGGG